MKRQIRYLNKTGQKMMKMCEKNSNPFLAKLEDKEEWVVKIYADLERMRDCISKTNPETKEEELLQNELNKKLNEYKQKSFEWMKKQAEEAQLNEIPPKESKQREKTIVLDSTYLVSKKEKENFSRVVKFLEEEYKSKGLEFVRILDP
ncbi:MAG: GvpL/GvpF family gas vesicle protein [candidate division Zixibacteria bacterium]|nr:GvpL/GvpF family gas vesicle protein [candidate division Zixibacteria bacterium]